MILTRLDIANLRNIRSLSIAPHPSLNLVTGSNGAGKSSILEAIQCISTGHSFRTRKARELIHREEQNFTLAALFNDPLTEREHRAGLLRKRDGGLEYRLDFEEISSIAEITRLLPVKSITPDSHKLVQDGPEERRQFLDWGVFHMEPRFYEVWKQFKRSLSQRNQLLRESGTAAELKNWDSLFADASNELDMMRQSYVQELSAALSQRLSDMNTTFHVELHYRRGWAEDSVLAELLVEHVDYHRRMKTTTDGPHRAELVLQTDGSVAKQVLSRGQQKVLVYLLHLAQLDLLSSKHTRRAVVLCDDLTSELDAEHSTNLINQLVALNSQIFVSGVNLDVLKAQSHTQIEMTYGALKNVV